MRIDEALAESKPLDVKFGASVLHIEYRPPSYTIEQMVAAENDKANPERLVTMLQDLIVGWDLTRYVSVKKLDGSIDEQEVPIDITNADDVRRFVPSPIIMGIVRAINKDNDPSGD